MRVAVLTLTRDRLDYTQHAFATLAANAGCDYDHYVLDQGSRDDTPSWLAGYPARTLPLPANIGISRGLNMLLDQIDLAGYDVIVKFDNDCELTQPGTLRDVASATLESGWLLSPRILGLRNPPRPTREIELAGETVLDVPQIGGIFLAAPASLYDEFRYADTNPVWGGDDTQVCAWYRARGGGCGYLKRLEAIHHETTDGQHARYPDYFAQKRLEGCPV